MHAFGQARHKLLQRSLLDGIGQTGCIDLRIAEAGRRLDDLAAPEAQADVLHELAHIAEGDLTLERLFDGAVEDLPTGHIEVAVVDRPMPALEAEGEVGTGGEQPYRVLWAWTYFLTQRSVDGQWHLGTLPGNPFIWVLYLLVLCGLGLVAAVRHDPESDQKKLGNVAVGLAALAVVLGVLTMTVGYTDAVLNPGICTFC